MPGHYVSAREQDFRLGSGSDAEAAALTEDQENLSSISSIFPHDLVAKTTRLRNSSSPPPFLSSSFPFY
jgi:hypothetical protein